MEIQVPPSVPVSSAGILEAFERLVTEFLRSWRMRLVKDAAEFPLAEIDARQSLALVQGWLLATLLSDPEVKTDVPGGGGRKTLTRNCLESNF